jgi:dTDP-4-amino-4,6-dideoxygalactose transaminase
MSAGSIPISRPLFGAEEMEAVLEPLRTGWVVQGPKVAAFEAAFAEHVGTPHAIATSSCTTALHLALVALDVGPGDEVVVPAFTWVATANVVEMQGARPVFVDVDLETFNASAEVIEAAITPRTKVIMPVSLFGLSAPMGPILEIARARHLRVVEDDACAIGTWYEGRHAGTLADVGCFSFHPRKAITTGEGGMLITRDPDLAARVRSLRDHGASVSDLDRHQGARSFHLPDFDMVGYNYRMTDLQGALGVAQLARLDGILAERTRLARRYDEALRVLQWLRTPRRPANGRHGYQAYVCLYAPEPPTVANAERLHAGRNALMSRLEEQGIATRPGTHALHLLGVYRRKYGLEPSGLPGAYLADRVSLALPLFAGLTDAQQDFVVERLGAAADDR